MYKSFVGLYIGHIVRYSNTTRRKLPYIGNNGTQTKGIIMSKYETLSNGFVLETIAPKATVSTGTVPASKERAKAFQDFLTANGIDRDTVESKRVQIATPADIANLNTFFRREAEAEGKQDFIGLRAVRGSKASATIGLHKVRE